MAITDIQFDMFPACPPLHQGEELLELLRPHKWAHGEATELALVSIELVPHGDQWMWATCLNSRNGAGQGCRALPKWNRFAPTKTHAMLRGADEVRAFMHRATDDEQTRIATWLAEQVSRAVAAAE
ncbi:hypothetical protein CJU35_05595 [Pseudomonas aeruginosa]|nr:hypothetical protein CJU35_05595 [Pseudomonas aeruginosa]